MNLNRTIVALSLVFAGAVSLGACKQKEGEICQIDNDCESGLVCNAATGRCQTPGQAGVDAGPNGPVDAAVDAPPADAGVDAS